MKVSIVTISYNQAEFLEEAILSVLEQDYADVEYIVVDPGSTDGSREIIEKYRDKIDHIIFESDDGPSDGLNKGFKLATGELFGFLNSDDILLDGAVLSAVKIFKENTSIDVISGHGYIIDRNSEKKRKVFSDRYSLFSDAYGQCVLVQPSTFFLANVFRKVGGFNIANRSNWDGELFYNMAQVGAKFMRVNVYWSGYRLYPESITGSSILDSKINAFAKRRFVELMGREKKWYDILITFYLKVLKHVSNPKALLERLIKGKIYGQG